MSTTTDRAGSTDGHGLDVNALAQRLGVDPLVLLEIIQRHPASAVSAPEAAADEQPT